TTRPHITLAHTDRGLAATPWLAGVDCRSAPLRVDDFELLVNPGGRYEPLGRWRLSGGAGGSGTRPAPAHGPGGVAIAPRGPAAGRGPRSGADRWVELGALAHDRHRRLQRLLVVQARVHGRAVGAREVDLGEVARATDALGHVLAGQLQVHAAQAGAGRSVDVERLLDLAADVV